MLVPRPAANAVIIAILIAMPVLVVSESTAGEDQEQSALVVASATGKSDSEHTEKGEPAAVGRAPDVDAPPPAPYVRTRFGTPDPEEVGSGIKRSASAGPTPLALAPGPVALTISESPSLFWHIDALPGEGVRVMFTITDDRAIEPLKEITLATPSKAGIQRLRLVELGIELEPEINYMWSISVVSNAESDSNDDVSTRYIRRVQRPQALDAGSQDGLELAEAGIWYDAFEAMSNAVDDHPDDKRSRSLRNALLREARLDAAAEGDY
jgi:hypothetical protein